MRGEFLTTSILLACGVAAQQPAWAQCGGQGYSGGTTCTDGYACVSVNQWYSQCQAGAAAPSMVTTTRDSAPPADTGSPAPAPGNSGPESNIRYLGRVNPATKELTWPGTGVTFTFTGTSATINIKSSTGTNSFNLEIDGGAPTVLTNVAGAIKTPQLSSGKHTVVFRRRDETVFGTVFLGDITTDGTFVATAAPTRQIEVIGDSISVGYGMDGVNPCSNNAAVTDNPKTYGQLAAQALGAAYSAVAWSGKGLVRNIATGSADTSPLIPELYTRYGANDADNTYTFPSSWKPQAVVITLGTNDFSYLGFGSSGSYKAREPLNAAQYTAGMVKFVQSIQTHYPDAHFFLSTSPMLSDFYPTTTDAQKTTQTNALKDAIKQIGAKAHFVDWPTQGSDVACDYHPNAATNAAQAKVLQSAISAALGW